MTTEQNGDSVLVIGAGIAGMAAGMHLAELGQQVLLLDSAPAIGGSMHLLDHTFPTNSCGICLMLPQQPSLCPTLECQQRANLRLLPYAELVGLTGEPGNFVATVRHKPRYVDGERCNRCGVCGQVCPESRPHDYEGRLHPVKAIYRPAGLRAVPDTWVVDMQTCTRCGECVAACPTQAIDLDMQPWEEELAVGAVLLTPGFAPFDARIKGEYGYQVYPNVLSSLEFERMVSLAGSSVARITRPAGGTAPRRVAFIQCVGSRDPLCGAGHCSSACCMYTAKQVALAKKLDPGLEITVFFMDLRAFGKQFEAYLDAVQALPGVTYRRAMPSSVHEKLQTRELMVTYPGEDGKLREETFDLLVLAVGFAPPPGMQALARTLGLELNPFGFALGDAYHPAHTGRPGVFLAGAFREPKDIPETVAEAAGAAAEVASFLAARHLPLLPEEGKAEATLRDVADEEPRIGVFACECNGEMAVLDIPRLLEQAKDLPGVVLAQVLPLGCTPEGRSALLAAIEADKLNRVVVAGCSPRLFGDEFEATMRSAGLDPRLLARVNLREQVAYPHASASLASGIAGSGPDLDLHSKASSLVGMAVAGLKAIGGLEAWTRGTRQILTRRALVLGGGAAGMSAALELDGLGIPVDLVEREEELGGQWRHLHAQPDGSDPQAELAHMVEQVRARDGIRLHLGAELIELGGTPGNYHSVVGRDGAQETLDHGAIVVATGGKPAATTEYLYGRHPAVVTQRELELKLASPNPDLPAADTVVMIQCAGSREPSRPYCSRICCTQAIKNALKLKERSPGTSIYVLYRDVRTYGFREAFYQAARDAGVVFLRYELPAKPQVAPHGERVRVSLREPVAGLALDLEADLLVLSTGVEPEDGTALAGRLGIKLDADGFFLEEHPKMKPLDLGKAGMFVAGLAHSPRFLEETILHGQGAAMRAAAWLAPQALTERPTSVWVNERLCSFCGLCVEACPYQARVMNYDTRVADVDYALCQGCGVCAMICPNKATKQKSFEHKQVMAAVDMAVA